MEYIQYPKTFKRLVEDITYIASEDDRNELFYQIGRSFENEKISFKEFQLLGNLVSMIDVNRR